MNSAYTAIESDVPEQAQQPSAQSNATSAGANVSPSEWTWSQKLKESSHPIALLFYIFFRVSPLFIYLFGTLLIGIITKKNKFILHFIIIVLLVSGDFWNLKNIAGRLLVGLRWWNEVSVIKSTNGEFENVWVFETADPNRYINPIDSKVFWTLLYVQPAAWVVLGFLALLKFEFLYLLLIIISISLSLTNAMAFTKCDKFGKANHLATDIFSRATGNLFSRLNPFST